MSKSKTVDMCNGPLFSKILFYAIPLALTGMLQLLYNAADVIVVGQFAGHSASAAVTSTGSLINLLINIFSGLSVGVMATIARYYGAQEQDKLHRSVHTSVLLSLICGVIVGVIGFTLTEPLLLWMKTPADVMDQAVLYVRIYFLGMPGLMVFNFGAAILRAAGDTKRTALILVVSGLVNVVLNLVLVILFHLDVAGVAIATTVSQYLSAVLVVICLLREQDGVRLIPSQLRIYPQQLVEIVRIGLPAGIQGSLFSIANVLIQSSINEFGSVVMAGNGIAGNLEGFVYIAMNAFYQAALSFAGQNLGARKPKRINRTLRWCLLLVTLTGLLLSGVCLLFAKPLLSIYSSDAEVVTAGVIRLQYLLPLYFMCGVQEVLCGQLRGMGFSFTPMIAALIGACALRIGWIATIFQWFPQIEVLYFSFTVSWILTALAHYVTFLIVRPRVFRRLGTPCE